MAKEWNYWMPWWELKQGANARFGKLDVFTVERINPDRAILSRRKTIVGDKDTIEVVDRSTGLATDVRCQCLWVGHWYSLGIRSVWVNMEDIPD